MTAISFAGRRLVPAMIGAMIVALPLAACSSGEGEETVAAGDEITEDTLAAALADSGDMATVSEALKDTGLAPAFDGTASYTILAPTDTAFAQVDSGLERPESKALLAAVLREHILPGALAPDDIAKAIEGRDNVEMQTMGDGVLTFTAETGGIRVTDEDGGTAMLADEAVRASNGVAIPVDAVLKKPAQ